MKAIKTLCSVLSNTLGQMAGKVKTGNFCILSLIFQIKMILQNCSCLLNLLNALRKRDKMRGLPSILSLFEIVFDKFNYTGARM